MSMPIFGSTAPISSSCIPPKFINFSLKLPTPVSDVLMYMSVGPSTARKPSFGHILN